VKGPLKGHGHLWKIRVHGPTLAMRPIMCVGPFGDDEFTLLIGAREVNWEWEPAGAPEEAERRRSLVLMNRFQRAPYTVPQP
jgi:hypothetical protein